MVPSFIFVPFVVSLRFFFVFVPRCEGGPASPFYSRCVDQTAARSCSPAHETEFMRLNRSRYCTLVAWPQRIWVRCPPLVAHGRTWFCAGRQANQVGEKTLSDFSHMRGDSAASLSFIDFSFEFFCWQIIFQRLMCLEFCIK